MGVLGAVIVTLIVPFSFTLVLFYRGREERKIWVSNAVIIAYFVFELLLDYVLRIPFRDIISLHVVYIIVFYAADFSMLGVVFNKNRKAGIVTLASLMFLISCLTYMYIG